MGRGRSKGKKNQDDLGSGEEEKIPAQKRRGRPLKVKDDVEEDEAPKLEDEDSDDTTGVVDKDASSKNGKKRKKNAQVKDKSASVKEETESGNGTRSSVEESNKSNGFRHSRSRRKNTPRRAAEAVVECN